MRSYPIRVAPKPGVGVLVRRGHSDTGRASCDDRGRIGGTCLQAKVRLGLPAGTGSWRQACNTPSCRTLRRNPPTADTRISDLHFSEVPETKFLQLQEFSGSL